MRYIFQGRVRDNFGNVTEGTAIKIYKSGTVSAAKVYENETGGSAIQTLPQVLSDSNGSFVLWVDDADYSFTQLFDVVVDNIKYEKIDIMNRETAAEVSYEAANEDDWTADSGSVPDDVKEALDDLAETAKTIGDLFETDVNDNLMPYGDKFIFELADDGIRPTMDGVIDEDFEIDGSGNIMPKIQT